MTKSYEEIVAEFPRLSQDMRDFLRKIESFQRGKCAKEGGWVSMKYLGGSHTNSLPRFWADELVNAGFLQLEVVPRRSHGYKIPLPEGYGLPTEDEINCRRLSYKGQPVPF